MKRKNHNTRLLTLLALILMSFASANAQKTYVVCVGLNVYDNGENPLPCSRADAQSMANFYDTMGNSDVFVLLDKNATREHILRVLKNRFSKATEKDQIVFVYSGHGFEGGVSCYDTKNLIYCNEIQQIMQRSKAARKIMFINSCHSGSFKTKYNKDKGRGYNSKNNNVLLYMSSRPDELSWESYGMQNSFFINRLIQALKGYADKNNDGHVTAREMFNYVNAKVISDTNNMQHPQMYGKFGDDLVITSYK